MNCIVFAIYYFESYTYFYTITSKKDKKLWQPCDSVSYNLIVLVRYGTTGVFQHFVTKRYNKKCIVKDMIQ